MNKDFNSLVFWQRHEIESYLKNVSYLIRHNKRLKMGACNLINDPRFFIKNMIEDRRSILEHQGKEFLKKVTKEFLEIERLQNDSRINQLSKYLSKFGGKVTTIKK